MTDHAKIEDLHGALSAALADASRIREELKTVEDRQAAAYAKVLGHIEKAGAQIDKLQKELDENKHKVEAYDTAMTVVERQGFTRTEYALYVDTVETKAEKLREAQKTDAELIAEIEGFLFSYDLPDIYKDDQERVAVREELCARILLRTGRITAERYREACVERGWNVADDSQIAALVSASEEGDFAALQTS